MTAARLTRGADVQVAVVTVTVDSSCPSDEGDVCPAAETGERLMTSADSAGNKRRCRRTGSGLDGVFSSKRRPIIT